LPHPTRAQREYASYHHVKIADTQFGLADLDTPQGQMTISVQLMGARQNVRKLSINSKRGLSGRVQRKLSSGRRPAYGLRRVPEYSETEKDMDGRAVRIGVRIESDPKRHRRSAASSRCTRGVHPKRQIARTLNAERIPSRGAGGSYAGRPNSGTWSTGTVKNMLENRIYVGHRVWNRWSRTGDKLTNGKNSIRRDAEQHWDRVA
jgi:DNA invertase Pin-like site-specific DNA recombinase